MTGAARRSIRKPAPGRLRRWPLMAATLTLALVSACGGGDDAGPADAGDSGETPAADGEVQEVVFLNDLPIETLSFSPELVATCAGFFEDNGLSVTFESAQGSAQATNLLIAGQGLLARPGDIHAIQSMAGAGAPMVMVGTTTKDGTIRIVSAEQDPLEQPEDFEGKIIGLPSVGGTSEQTVDIMLADAGIDPASVERQVTGLAPGVFDLVTAGRIAGYLVSLDTALSLQAQRPEAVLMNPTADLDAGTLQYAVAQESVEDPERSEQIRRYLAAIADAMRFMRDDEANGFQETMDCIAGDFEVPALADPAVAQEALSTYVAGWFLDGDENLLRTDPEQWTGAYEEMVNAGFVPEGENPEEWITNEFVPEAE
jgi:NitT/TauT family transport system substrate-binding protein